LINIDRCTHIIANNVCTAVNIGIVI